MEVKTTFGAQAVRFVQSSELPEEKKVPLYRIIKAMQERYFFIQVPAKIDEIDFTKGVNFFGGLFEYKTIDKFQVFQNGVVCEGKVGTDHCDRFIDDVLKFAGELGLPIAKQTAPDRAYFSSLEVYIDGDFSKATKLSPLQSFMLEKFHSYGHTTPVYPVIGFKMGTDTTIASVPIPGEFVFERRAGTAFSESLYASWGPFRTEDHLALLVEIEKIMTS
ncbi:MAG TPA: hypothetical protein VIY68_03755 [Steroidobacteraceae bacterium]